MSWDTQDTIAKTLVALAFLKCTFPLWKNLWVRKVSTSTSPCGGGCSGCGPKQNA